MEENCYAGGVINEHEKSEITFDIVCEYGKLVEIGRNGVCKR